MLRSLFSAISGLQAHQTKMDTVSNNIANVNTVGYKSQTTVFEDTLSQLIRGGSAPAGTTGGTNPAQVGLGVQVAGITTNFGQGSTQSTGRASDFMISGDGFFVIQSGTQQLYTRAGSFDLDGSNRLVTPNGALLQGWSTIGADGKVDTNGPTGPLTIPYGSPVAPDQTTGAVLSGNLNSTATAPAAGATTDSSAVQSQVTMYDKLGNAHALTYTVSKTGDNTWKVDVLDGTTSVLGGSKSLTFDPATGQLTKVNGAAATSLSFTPDATKYPSWTGPVTIDLSGLTQFGSASSLSVGTPPTGAGSAMGTLESYTLGDDGTITGVYSNGLRKPIGQLALATFSNPGGLVKSGDSTYATGDNSGQPSIGAAGSGGRGTLTSGALEMSNVDLSQEFTGLIIAQRGFQANSKVITTSDQILNDLVNMKQ